MVRPAKGERCPTASRGNSWLLQRVSENADVPPVTLVLAHTLVALALAQDTGLTPRRLVAHFNFEESAEFNPGVPTNWNREKLGYPQFGQVETAEGIGRAGNGKGYAVRFQLDGASMAFTRDVPLDLEHGAVAPGSHLMLRAWTHTEGLRHAAVRLSARFLDANGDSIAGVYPSELLRAETQWRMLEVYAPPTPANAKVLQIWLEAVQPEAPAEVGGALNEAPFTVPSKDIHGRAYFDDIEVWQMPSVKFEPESLGMVAAGARAKLQLRCDDPMVRESTVDVRVRDAGNAIVFQKKLVLPADREITLEVPELATGWYEAEANFTNGKNTIARRFARMAVLTDDPFEPEQPPRFGASLVDLNMSIEPAISLARSAFVVLPVWSESTELRDPSAEIEFLRPLVGRLLDMRVEPMFRLRAVPARLASAERIDGSDTLGLFGLDETRWRPALEPWLLAFGQRVDQWFIGTDPVDADRSDLATRMSDIARTMGSAIAGPVVTLPWAPEELVPSTLESTIETGHHALEIVADAAWRESGGEAYDGFAKGERAMVRIVPLPVGSVSERDRAIDLALRAIDAWRAGFDTISIEVRQDEALHVPGPALELAAWRQISTRLCGRRFVAEIPIAEGVRALLANGARGPALLLWNEAGVEEVAVDVDLGAQTVHTTDLWGRSRDVPPTTDGHALRIGREPMFIEGLSAEMCLLRKGFRVDPMFAESRRAPQEGVLVLANPWKKPLSGTLTVLGPDALGITPKTHRFNIPAGEEARMTVNFSVPRITEAGPIPVRVEVSATAEAPFRATMASTLEIGYRKAVVEPSWRLARSMSSGQIDLVLTLRVTNVSDAPIDVEAFAGAEGYSRDRKLVSALAPGATAVRAFHFADGARKLSGRDIRTGVHDAEADTYLLKRVSIPALMPPTESVAGADSSR
ncbi:MAG: hypothetical protein RLY72_1063 [Planctomycetota bacterium]